jgi:hypothetical protein
MKNMSLKDLKKLVFIIGFVIVIPFLVAKGFAVFKEGPSNVEYRKAYFYTAAVCGMLCTVLGLALRVNFIGAGFILGGLITVLTGLMFSWSDLSGVTQFAVLIGLFLLLLVGSYYVIVRSKK